MKQTWIWVIFPIVAISVFLWAQAAAIEKGTGYLLPGDIKEGWKVFTMKRCGTCHAIWGEGGKGGPDLGPLPKSYVSPAQLAALMWNHGPEMWGRMSARKLPLQKMSQKEMADLFAFLYFIRYMDEPGDPKRGKTLMETKGCGSCHIVREGAGGDLTRWGMYTNPILWAQMMWNHEPQMEQAMKKKGLPWIKFKENEMVDLISYIRRTSETVEKIYLSPGDPQSGEKLFSQKGCVQCHIPLGELDLSRKKDFPRTLAQLAGTMWNHSHEMWKRMIEKGIDRPWLTPQEMANLVAYLFATRYFDEPGNPVKGKAVFNKKQCHLCHGRGKKPDLSILKDKISPIFMAQTMWNHGPEMMEKMRKAKVPWQKIDEKEMVDLMEYLNRGML